MTSQLSIQHNAIKRKYNALPLFKCGEFYEAINGGAIMLCRITGLTLSHNTDKRPLAGFQAQYIDKYLTQLIKAGCKVAIVEENA